MRLPPHEIAILFIAGSLDDTGDWPDPRWAFDSKKVNAHTFLVELTGEDFGLNAEGWRVWFAECDDDLIQMLYDEFNKETIAVMKSREARELSWDEFMQRLKARGEQF